ncbi:hypothetical protein [Spiroplasma clarkii]|uniref:hypothetical protein n=1 Tax=Spiroplasma clarkii TaxID=2139 RepID=UPI0011BA7C3A|nr:hypothetical protein [Spiroplasma clarkii]
MKIRGYTGGGKISNNYSVHIWVDSKLQKIYIKAYSNWIDMNNSVFATIKLFDEEGNLVKTLEILSKDTEKILGLMTWDFDPNYTIQVEFNDADFKLDSPNGDGSKIYNHKTRKFEPIANVILKTTWEAKL